MEPLQKLFSSLIDYAGLFPPAGLNMPVVADNYAQYMQGAHSWMLARLVVPLARLDEFESAWSGPGGLKTRISLLTPALDAPEFADAVNRIAEFNHRTTPHIIDAVEVRVTDPAAVSNALKLPTEVACFVEVPADNMSAVVNASSASAALVLLLLLLSRLLSLLLVKMRLFMMLLLMLLLLSMLTVLSAPVLVSPVVPPSFSPSSCATPIAPTRVGSNKGVSRLVSHLLFPRHLHLPVRAQYHILKDFATRICVGEQNALLDSERVGEVAGKVVVSINI